MIINYFQLKFLILINIIVYIFIRDAIATQYSLFPSYKGTDVN